MSDEPRKAIDQVATFITRRDAALNEIVSHIRSLPPLLRDHSLSNTATELEAKLFQLDAIEGEMRDYFNNNREDVAREVFNALFSRKP